MSSPTGSGHAETVGDYRLDATLGYGAMGEVYRARDLRRERTVALKLMRRDLSTDPEYRARFRREVLLAAGLGSPHVVPVHDFGEIDGRLFLDMRLVEGRDLRTLLAGDGPLRPQRAVAVVEQVAEALDAAHHAGLVHRDVKPSNILLTVTARGEDFAYLADFGVARALEGTTLTATGTAVGTAEYMAPELFTAGHDADHRADVYALGATLVELLTGDPPFPVPTVAAQLYHHVHVAPPAPSGRGVAGFDDVVARALAKEPDRRYGSASALATDARRALETIPPAPPEPDDAVATRAPDPRRRGWLVPTGVVATALGVIVAAIVGVVALAPETSTAPTVPAVPTAPGPAALTTSAARPLPVPLQNGNAVTIAPDGSRAYVSDGYTRMVLAVDLASGRVVDTYGAGVNANSMDLSRDGRTLAVADRGFDDQTGGGVSLIDLATRTTTPVRLPGRPGPIRITGDGRTVYVADRGNSTAPGRTLTEIDVASATVTRTVGVGAWPRSMVLSPDESTLYVSCPHEESPLGAVVVAVPVDGRPSRTILTRPLEDLAVAIDGMLYGAVTDESPPGPGVDVIDQGASRARARTVDAPQYPQYVAVAPDRRHLVVAGTSGSPPVSTLAVLDAARGTTVTTAALPPGAHEVEITPDGTRALVVSSGALSEVDMPR